MYLLEVRRRLLVLVILRSGRCQAIVDIGGRRRRDLATAPFSSLPGKCAITKRIFMSLYTTSINIPRVGTLSLSLSTHWISSPNPLPWKSASSSALRPRSLGCSPNTLFSAGAELSPPQPSPVVAVAVAGGFMSLMLFIVPDSIRMHPARWPSHELLMSQRAARPGFLLHSSDVFFEGRRNDDSTIRGTLSGTRARSFRSATLF